MGVRWSPGSSVTSISRSHHRIAGSRNRHSMTSVSPMERRSPGSSRSEPRSSRRRSSPVCHHPRESMHMTTRPRSRIAAVLLMTGLAVVVAGAPAAAQSGPSDWQVLTDGPALGDLTAGVLASVPSGVVVLVGYSGSTAPTKGKKPLAATSDAWYSPDGTAWTEAALAGRRRECRTRRDRWPGRIRRRRSGQDRRPYLAFAYGRDMDRGQRRQRQEGQHLRCRRRARRLRGHGDP